MGRRERRNAGTEQGAPESGDVTKAPVRLRKRMLQFAVDNPKDTVQRHLVRGELYEARMLRTHADLIFRGATVLDVGANIGNHTVFYSLTAAGRVYPFEPNPRANRLLRQTVEWNELEKVDLTHLDNGVGSRRGELFVRTPNDNNLGASRLAKSGGAKVPVVRLDDLTFEGEVGFVKIDVEGMEMGVLAGAEGLIARHRPSIAIEVDNENLGAFWTWADKHDYHVMNAVKMYPRNINYLCVPRGPRP